MPKDPTPQQCLETIARVFDVQALLAMPMTKKNVAKYYKINQIAYRLFHSSQGFVHMGLSEDGTFHEEDFHAQADAVSEYIKRLYAKNVLELGMGKGANLMHLAKRHPDTQFYGLDLPNGQLKLRRFRGYQNITAETGDFHDLSRYEERSMDIVFMVEAFSYAESKQKVLEEVARVLKTDGLLIIYEGYNVKPLSNMSNEEETLVRLGWVGMAIDPDKVYVNDFKNALSKAGFRIQEEVTLNKQIMPSLYRLQKESLKFFGHPRTAKLINKIFPQHFTANAVSGYLMPWAIKRGLSEYLLTVAKVQKDTA